jgi:uncharacterized membrane protein YcaP (DUF421 family)
VEYALLEINGKLSVQKKKELHAVTLKDLQLNAGNAAQYPIELVIDGKLLHDTLNSNKILNHGFCPNLRRAAKS